MISNFDLTEMCELLISMWTAPALVIKSVMSTKALVLLLFCFVGNPHLSQNRYVEMKPAIVLVMNEMRLRSETDHNKNSAK